MRSFLGLSVLLFTFSLLISPKPALAQDFWQPTSLTVPAEIDNAPQGALYYHNGSTLYRSSNGGVSWDSIWNITSSRINRVQIASDASIFVATEGSGIYRCTDGVHFTQVNSGLTGLAVRPICFGQTSQVFVGTYDHYFFRSSNNGDSWSQCTSGLGDNNVSAVVAAPSGVLYAGVKGGNGLYKSTDHGETWVKTSMTTSARVMSLYAMTSGTILAFTGEDYPDGIYRSSDAGTTWTRVANAGIAMSEFPPIVVGSIIYAAADRNGVFRSTDDGATWESVNSGLTVTGVPNTGAISLAFGGGYLWVSTHFGIFRSTNTVLGVTTDQTPARFTLGQNYPNPFNPSTTIDYTLGAPAHVNLTVFDLLGRQVAVLADGHQTSGEHSVSFDARSLPSGVYMYRLTVGNTTSLRSMIIAK